MKGYWLTLCHITDSELYSKYIKLAGPAIEKYGGKFLARGGQQTKLEGESFERTVLIEFPSIDAAEEGDFAIAQELYELLKKPYGEQIKFEKKWFQKRPE